MKRIKAPNGSQVNFETLVDNIQVSSFDNLKKRIAQLADITGLNISVNNNVLGPEFALSLISTNDTLSVASGNALTASGEYIKISTSLTTPNLAKTNTNTGYGIVLSYKEVGSDPVKALNAFVYDALGSQSLNRKTVYSDSVSLSLEPIGGTLQAFEDSLATSQILLGVLWDTTGTYVGPTVYPTTDSGTFRIADMREKSRMLLSESLISDKTVLYRDRPSTGDNAFDQDIEFSADVLFNRISPSPTGDGVLSAKGLTMLEGFEKTTNVEGTIADNFYIRVGAPGSPDGLPLAVADGPLTAPSNIRVYDINPAPNREEGYSLVTFKWNWSDLNGTINTANEITIEDTAFNGESVDLSTVDGKRLYFTSSGNSYLINSVTAGTGNYTLTLDETIVASDTIDSNNPARVIDHNVREYIFSVKDVDNSEVEVKRLEETFVNNPTITLKLQLGETYAVTMQALNQGGRSSLITMQGGSYNPDWSDGAQPVVNYNSEFKNKLPNIPTTGSIQLAADAQGFTIQIGGWIDESDATKTAHSFEILYDLEVPITQNSFDSLAEGLKERDIMLTRLKHISSGSPKRYSVGVRPLQNGQPVGAAIIKDVTSGGGGILPTEQLIATIPVDIEVNEIVIEDPAPTADPRDYNGYWTRRGGTDRIIRPHHRAAGEWLSRLDGVGVPIDEIPYRINEHLVYDGADISIQRIRIPDAPTATATERFATGISKKARKIAERKLDIDYRITKMELSLNSAEGVTPTDPGIIRVYQKDMEGSAAKMEIEGYQSEPVSQTADLPILAASDGSRIMIIDGWDPDSTTPNNDCEFKGTLTITGMPYVSDRLG